MELKQFGWDLSAEYYSFHDERYASHLSKINDNLELANALSVPFRLLIAKGDLEIPSGLLHSLQAVRLLSLEVRKLSRNMGTYVGCRISIDGSDVDAKQQKELLVDVSVKADLIEVLLERLEFLLTSEQAEAYLKHPELSPYTFQFYYLRSNWKERILPINEEELLVTMSQAAFHPWGELHSSICSVLTEQCEVDGQVRKVGLAELDGLIQSSNKNQRHAAWHARSRAWAGQAESAAATLNSLARWRIEEAKRRSYAVPLDFLEPALIDHRVSREAISCMMSVCKDFRAEAQSVLKVKARCLGDVGLYCADLAAPAPAVAGGASPAISFPDALQMVAESHAIIHPAFSEFIYSMRDLRCIEARVLPAKQPGAYCTFFEETKSSKIFQTYLGSLGDVKTLAHELGHAFHNHVTKDLDPVERYLPSTLAETASNVGELILGEYLVNKASSDAERFAMLWTETEDMAAYMLNLPARFDFEYKLYAERAKGKLWQPKELCALTEEVWGEWYGDALQNYDSWFWAWKLHFHYSDTRFYNYPYTFGYLFSRIVYNQLMVTPSDFYERYSRLLRDTGRMTANELVRRHLGMSIEEESFWRSGLDEVKIQIRDFFDLAASQSK
jgi:oligoendopeptidase F